VKSAKPAPPGKKKSAQVRASPEARKLVEDLQRRLGTKVRLVERGSGKGTLEVEFFSYEDLDRIIHLIKR
jgi:ParB family chromosome partitioning protein